MTADFLLSLNEIMHHAPYREMLEAAALNLLEKAEQRMFDEHLAFCHNCETELAAYQATIALLFYTAEPVEPPFYLRERLLERIRRLEVNRMYNF